MTANLVLHPCMQHKSTQQLHVTNFSSITKYHTVSVLVNDRFHIGIYDVRVMSADNVRCNILLQLQPQPPHPPTRSCHTVPIIWLPIVNRLTDRTNRFIYFYICILFRAYSTMTGCLYENQSQNIFHCC